MSSSLSLERKFEGQQNLVDSRWFNRNYCY